MGERFLKHHLKSQIEGVLGSTITDEHVLINRYRTLKQGSQLFSIEKFFEIKNFSYICDPNKSIH